MDEHVEHVGQQFGNYRLTRLIGQGGFAEVYLGEHVYLKTQAAIKVLQLRLVGSNQESFLTEAQTIARLEHPHIVQVLDYGVQGTIPFLVMSYAPNGTLRQRFPTGSIVPLETVVSYVQQTADALQYAHEAHLIHRDVKPENLLLGRAGDVQLSDFGLALAAPSSSHQSTQVFAGTVAYMAPEHIQGKPRPASDQYSLGVIVYEWLCGQRPFRGSFVELCAQHIYVQPPLLRSLVPTLPPPVEEVVLTALVKEPQKRFGSVRAFARALEQAAQEPPTVLINPIYMPQAVPGAPMPTFENALGSLITPELSSSPKRGSGPPGSSLPSVPSNPLALSPTVAEAAKVTLPDAGSPLPAAAHNLTPPPSTVIPAALVAPSAQPVRRISRRMVLGALIVGGLAAGGGGWWWYTHTHSGQGGTQSPPRLGQLLYTYRGHPNYIAALAWSPHGNRIASGSGDRSVQVWDATSGGHVLIFQGHGDAPYGVAWSPDSRWVASGSADKTVRIWDPTVSGSTARLIYSKHTDTVNIVAWAPAASSSASHGQRIASAGYDNTAQVWDTATGQQLFVFRKHTDAIWGLAWSPDSRRIATGSFDMTVQVWDAANGRHLFTYTNHTDKVRSVSWSPDGKYIASGGLDKTVQVWTASTGNRITTYTGHTDEVYAVAWAPDGSGRLASTGGDRTVQVWDALTGQHIFTYRGHTALVNNLAWSPDGHQIVSGGNDSTAQVWQAV